jgi:diguanylate cyclase (GGDEF)-like protein
MRTRLYSLVTKTIWPGSIRTRLFLLVLFAVMPLAASRLWSLHESGQRTLAVAHLQSVDLVRSGLAASTDVIDDASGTLKVLSHVDSIVSETGQGCSILLAQLLNSKPWAAGFFALDASGIVVCSSAAENMGLNIADRAYVKDAIKSRSFVAGDFILGRASRVPMIGSALPVYDKTGALKRVLVATITVSWFERLANEIAMTNPSSTVTLIDSHGVVLAHAPKGAEEPGQQLKSAGMIAELANSGNRAFTANGADGEDRVFSSGLLQHSKGRLIVGLSRHSLLAEIARYRNEALLELCFVCIIMLGTMWWLGTMTLTGPIQSMLKHAEKIGKGQLDSRLMHRNWPRELAMLAVSMNRMAARIARRNAQLHNAQEQLRNQAMHDKLTELPNRRAFDLAIKSSWEICIDTGQKASLIMIDADCFKGFNDTYGHVAGDNVLVELGRVIKQVGAVHGASVARLGGEEFAILMPFRTEAQALVVADAVRQGVEKLSIKHELSPIGIFTISAGVADILPSPIVAQSELMKAADIALYAAKMSGRNRVMSPIRLRELVPSNDAPVATRLNLVG